MWVVANFKTGSTQFGCVTGHLICYWVVDCAGGVVAQKVVAEAYIAHAVDLWGCLGDDGWTCTRRCATDQRVKCSPRCGCDNKNCSEGSLVIYGTNPGCHRG